MEVQWSKSVGEGIKVVVVVLGKVEGCNAKG